MDDAEYLRRVSRLKPVSGGRRPEALNASRDANLGQLARGWAAGTLGLPGDIEGLVRMLPGLDETPVLPTSDFFLDWLPGKATRPVDRALAGLGTLGGGIGAFRAAGALEKAARTAAARPVERMARQSQRGAVRMKGGNFDPTRLDAYLGRDTEGAGIAIAGDRAPPVTDWANKQLANYIRKDLGSPTDPLLALEKELPGLHLPEDVLRDPEAVLNQRRTMGSRSNQGVDDYLREHAALTDAPPDLWQAYKDEFEELYGFNPSFSETGEQRAQWWDWIGQKAAPYLKPGPPEIVQIKGKQNAAPVEKYLPFVQDFVKSGQWGRVGDLKNAGLEPTAGAFTSAELRALQAAGAELPRYATLEEIAAIRRGLKPAGYATGGQVTNNRSRLHARIKELQHGHA